MKIDLARFRKSAKTNQRIHFEELYPGFTLAGEEISLTQPLTIDLELRNEGLIFQLEGSLNTRIHRNCSRCLQNTEFSVLLPIKQAFIHEDDLEAVGIPEETARDSEEYEIFNEQPFDLQPLIRDVFILSLPMSHLCQENCQGLCPQCGIDLNQEKCACQNANIDPRLMVLQEYFTKNDS